MTVVVTPAPDGVRVVARDRRGAPWVAVPCLAVGLPLLAWAVVAGHAIEAGGAVVFVGLGLLAAALAAAGRRDVVVAREGGGVRVRGREGAGPFARDVDLALPADAEPEVAAFAVPEGAPDLPDRGGVLVLRAPGVRFRLATAIGREWRQELAPAADALRTALGNRHGAGRRA